MRSTVSPQPRCDAVCPRTAPFATAESVAVSSLKLAAEPC
jgi:hypothetical protein